VFFVPLGIVVCTNVVSQLALMSTAQQKNEEVSMQKLADMDTDTDGVISSVEFMRFMLVALNKVDNETLEIIQGQYDMLSEGTGTLSTTHIREFQTLSAATHSHDHSGTPAASPSTPARSPAGRAAPRIDQIVPTE
jgi:hypothetical protein